MKLSKTFSFPEKIDLIEVENSNVQHVSFWRHALSVFIGLILKKINYQKFEYKMPETIGNYKLRREYVNKTTFNCSYKYGIYRNDKGNLVFAKIWVGGIKGFGYYNLRNEIVINSTLSSVVDRVSRINPKAFTNIYIPKVVSSARSKNYLIVLYEYVEGETCQNLSSAEKLEVIEMVISYFKYLYLNLTEKERILIVRKEGINYVLLYPFLLVKACLSHPKFTVPILKGVPIFLKSIPYLLNNNEFSIAHRDLRLNNILMTDKHFFPIDVEYLVITYGLYDHANVLTNYWGREDFYKLLIIYLEKEVLTNKNKISLFKGLGIYSVTHDLIYKNFEKQRLNDYMDSMEYIRRLK